MSDGFTKDYPLDAVLRAGLAARTEQIEAAKRIQELETENEAFMLAITALNRDNRELEAQVEKYKSEIRESCEDMRSEYRTCDLAHELGEKNKELEAKLDEQKNNYADQMQYGAEQWLRAEKAEAQLTEFQKLVDETDDVKKILNNP